MMKPLRLAHLQQYLQKRATIDGAFFAESRGWAGRMMFRFAEVFAGRDSAVSPIVSLPQAV